MQDYKRTSSDDFKEYTTSILAKKVGVMNGIKPLYWLFQMMKIR